MTSSLLCYISLFSKKSSWATNYNITFVHFREKQDVKEIQGLLTYSNKVDLLKEIENQ